MRPLRLASAIKSVVTDSEPELSVAKLCRAVGNLLVDDALVRTELALGRTPLADQIGDMIAWLREQEMLTGAPGRSGEPFAGGRRRG